MTVTRIDDMTALVVVDLQNAVRVFPYTDPITEVVANAAALAREFRARGLPVVLTEVDPRGGSYGRADAPASLAQLKDKLPADWNELMAELEPADDDLVVVKRAWGAFTGTPLAEFLNKRGVTQVVVCGVATAYGVESTARHASELGFNVTLPTDAMTDMSAPAQENSIERVFPRLGECGTTRDVLDRLGDR
ncbi:isochorismatase family cysteine hydrolase [Streptomyces sp. NBC_01089]|uniref:isochorismatase family cysteine hydrolase n=1 Tax=Streptomyces sp. NBC_01089 TaxID=2903747 RepID=UPI0038694513|nr:cysteine hydrolase [Streptomyces sp. NBC_01089]